jgi:plasmid stability protein
MATITLKNIPDDLYNQIKKSARSNRRSINSEIIMCVELALKGRKIDPEKVLAAARALRKKTRDYLFTEKDITKAKNAGRP